MWALPADEVTIERGIPVTTPARTLFDLAAIVGSRALERAVNEAPVLRLDDPLSLPDLLTRHPGRSGAARSVRSSRPRRSARG